MDSQFVVSFGVTLAIGGINAYQTYLTRKQLKLQIATMTPTKRPRVSLSLPWKYAYGPTLLMVLLAATSWIPYFLSSGTVPPLEGPYTTLIKGFGEIPNVPDMLFVEVNGGRLLPYRSDFKVGFVCFHWYSNRSTDVIDVTGLQKSSLYDIEDAPIRMLVRLDSQFTSEMKQSQGTNYHLLLVPKSVDMSRFSTLRQARALGVKEPWWASGPP